MANHKIAIMPGRRVSTLMALVIIAAITASAQSADDRYPFVKNGKVGFIDFHGREVIPSRFGNGGDTQHFQDGLAPVFEAGPGFGYIDASGKFVIGPTHEWDASRPFHEGLAGVLLLGKNGALNKPAWINRSGKVVFSGTGSSSSYFSEGLMSMPRQGKWGFVDKNFHFVIQPRFDWVSEFSEGRAEVTINHKSGFIDKSGRVVIQLKYDMVWGFSDGLARVRKDIPNGTVMTVEGEQTDYRYQYGFVDHEGHEVIPLQFEEATYFSEGYALAAPPNSTLLGVIDKQGKFVHLPEFEEGNEFHEGLAMVCVDKRCGYIDTSGLWVIPPSFSHGEDFWRGLARVAWEDGGYGYVDRTGKTIWKHTPDKQQPPGAK